jgi:ADP-ribose pyrophosphatase YjhB (NUDIX family)
MGFDKSSQSSNACYATNMISAGVRLTPIHQVASVLILLEADKYVLQLRDTRAGIWNPGLLSMWGGMVEANESPLEGAWREICEETNLTPERSDLKYIGAFPRGYFIGNRQVVNYLYAISIDSTAGLEIYEGQGFEIYSGSESSGRIASTTLEMMRHYRNYAPVVLRA